MARRVYGYGVEPWLVGPADTARKGGLHISWMCSLDIERGRHGHWPVPNKDLAVRYAPITQDYTR
jgi:hypothetical protein